MKKYKKFYEMDVWQEANELEKKIFKLTQNNYPKCEIYSLVDQINRSTNSVMANIAESHGRYHFLDRIRVLYIVRGEIQEVQNHLIVSANRGYIKKEESTGLIASYENLKIKINSYINSLYKQKSKMQDT